MNFNLTPAVKKVFLLPLMSLASVNMLQAEPLLELELATLLEMEITPSADASAKGLSPTYPGGQIAYRAREGLFGSTRFTDSPFSITSFTHQAIENWDANNLGELLQYSPTIRVTRGFGNFQQAYWVRGLPVFSDNMSYNGLFGILPRQILSTQFIERVEVLHGINSFASGIPLSPAGSLGGVINVLPKRAPKQDFSQVVLGASGSSEYEFALDIARRPVQEFGVRFNALERKGETEVLHEHKEKQMASLGLDYFRENYRLSGEISYQDLRLDGSTPSIEIATGLDIPDAPESARGFAQPWTYSAEEDLFSTIRAEFDFTPEATFWFAAGIRKSEEENRFTAFASLNDANGDFSFSRYDNTREDLTHSEQLGFNYRISNKKIIQDFIVAANYYSRRTRFAFNIYDTAQNNIYTPEQQIPSNNLITSGGELEDPALGEKTHVMSVAIAHRMRTQNNKFSTTFGIRWHQVRELLYDVNTMNLNSAYDHQSISPAIGGIYHLSSEYSLYANFVDGLESPVITPQMYQTIISTGEKPGFNRSKQKEIGIKYDQGELAATLSLFNIRSTYKNYNESNQLTATDSATRNGIEFMIFGKPTETTRIISGFSLFHTEINERHTIGIPNQQANLSLEWQPHHYQGVTFSSQFIHTGSLFADAENQQQLPSWNKIDIGMRYELPLHKEMQKLTIKAKFENIFDEDYWASAGGYPGESYLTLSDPRTFWIKSTLEF